MLHRREEILQELFEQARAAVAKIAEDEAQYIQLLEGTILQGFLQLMEPRATLFCREQDMEVVRRAGAAAAEQYMQMSGKKVVFDAEPTLSRDWYACYVCLASVLMGCFVSSGGIKLINGNKRITIDNTLDERLRLLEDNVRHFCWNGHHC